ncbi:MAG: hypothetical protein ACKPKO_35885, partial [Candidatus Fonsibacter sp.]
SAEADDGTPDLSWTPWQWWQWTRRRQARQQQQLQQQHQPARAELGSGAQWSIVERFAVALRVS